jgi:hypothetical protein
MRAIQIFAFGLCLFSLPFIIGLPLKAEGLNTAHQQQQQYDLILQALEQERMKNYPDLDE